MATTRKPSSIVATASPTSASVIIKSSGGTFVLAMTHFDFDHMPDEIEKTIRDGEAYLQFEHNGLQRGNYTLYGDMVSGAAIGLANLSSTNNPGVFKVRLDSTTDAGTFHNATMLISRVRGTWRHGARSIPVAISGIVTNTAPSSLESST